MDISSLRERNTDNTLTVSELNGYIKRLIDGDRILNAVTVRGEISNFVNHRSGHLYFSLKDAESQLNVVMFRSSAVKLRFAPENGMKVTIHGSVTVYQRDGSYQLYANSIQPDGVGALYLAYEQMKEKLYKEGLFDEIHKKPIPAFPERIGVITSPTGAAVRDIINVTGRRFPLAKIYLYPSLVQGEGAEPNLIRAVDYFDRSGLCDVIIIGRGGGSIEDLWAFNSEALARRIFECKTPVISAVGHETDFTICDFVSDVRAPTPSAAAEIAVPDIREIVMGIVDLSERLSVALVKTVERKRERLELIRSSEVIKNPISIVGDKREELDLHRRDLVRNMEIALKDKKHALAIDSEKLNALSPLSVLSRGYSIAQTSEGLIKSVDDAKVGDSVRLFVSDGELGLTVENITKRKGVQ